MKRVRYHINCANCGKKVTTNRKDQKYCDNKKCKTSSARKQMDIDIFEDDISRSNIGMFSEHYACCHFMARGYLVFNHMGANSPFDIVIYKDNKFTKVEVKTGRKNSDTGKLYYSKPVHEDYDVLCVICVTDCSVHTMKKDEV